MATKKRSSIINSAVFPDERRKRMISSIEFALRIIQLEKGDRSAETEIGSLAPRQVGKEKGGGEIKTETTPSETFLVTVIV